MFVYKLIDEKLSGQRRLDARQFVRGSERSGADIQRLTRSLEKLPDISAEIVAEQHKRRPANASAPATFLETSEHASLRADRKAGMSYRELAEKYNVVYSTAFRHARDVIVEAKSGKKGWTQLPSMVKEQLRADRKLGFTYAALASKYGIHHTTASLIARDVVVDPQPGSPPIKKAETVTTRIGDSEALAKRCEAVGWETEYTKSGIKVQIPDEGSYTIHMTYSDRRSLTNATADLMRQGLKEAEEVATQERASDRLKKLAADRKANEAKTVRMTAAQARQQKALLANAAGPYLVEPDDVELEWFTKAHPAPWMRWVWMTPELSSYLLEHHNKPGGAGEPGTNRPQSEATIRHYRDVIASGQWHLTHQGMASDTTGVVQDGQHRMAAILAAADLDPDVRVPVAYFVGMDPMNFKTIDEGLARTASQLFAMEGEKNGAILKSALRLIIAYRAGDESARNKWRMKNTNAQLIDAFTVNPDLLRVGGSLASGHAKKVPMSNGAFAALHFLLYTANGADNRFVTAFLHGISEGTLLNNTRLKLEDDDPRESLRTTLTSFKQKNEGRAASILDQLGMGILAWNKMIQGDHRRTIRWPKGTEIPQIILCKDTTGAVPPRALIGEVVDDVETDGE